MCLTSMNHGQSAIFVGWVRQAASYPSPAEMAEKLRGQKDPFNHGFCQVFAASPISLSTV